MNGNDHDLDLAGPYVLDALEPEEREAFEGHLRGCERCRAEVADLRRVTEALPLACDAVEPTRAVRDRVLEAVRSETPARPRLTALPGGTSRPGLKRRLSLPGRAFAVAAAVLVAALGLWDIQLQQRINDQQDKLRWQQATAAYEQAVATALRTGATVSLVTGSGSARAASAAMVQPPHGRAYLIVQGLPATPSNKVYQLWLMRGKTPRSAGVFRYSGIDPRTVPVPMPTSGYSLAAVTVEPRPRGSRGPTSQPILAGRLVA
ncbi:MAG: anti-sigma factor [Chloroflexi bacterium]|nr:anti-sigma factor [Chloroflexota bacterium]